MGVVAACLEVVIGEAATSWCLTIIIGEAVTVTC